MEKPAVVVEERYLKTGNPILYSKWKRRNNMLYDTIIPAIGFLAVCLLIYWRAEKW